MTRGNYYEPETLAAIDVACSRNRTEHRRESAVAAAVRASAMSETSGGGGDDTHIDGESLGSSFARRLTVGGLIEERVFDQSEDGEGDGASFRTAESSTLGSAAGAR